MTITLPRSLEDLTPAWLTRALRARCPGVTVEHVEVEHVIWGTATKVLINAQYSGNIGEQYGLPNRLCIKGEFDERSRQALDGMATTGTQVEANVFNELAAQLGVPLPRHWYGDSEPGMGVLILDNLAVQGFNFGTPTQTWSADQVAQALDILAILHGSTWGKCFPEMSWLTKGSTAVRQAAHTLMSDAHWQAHFRHPEVYQLPATLNDNQRLMAGYQAMWAYDDAHADYVVHGDAHVGNTCIDPQGRPFFIDWAGPCYAHWAIDVPYFMIGALSVDDRRKLERELFEHYLQRLAAHAGPTLDRATAWDDYRRHIVHPMMWAVLPPALQSIENVHAMGERYCSAMVEHDTLNRLGV